jgi:hypothetical protein
MPSWRLGPRGGLDKIIIELEVGELVGNFRISRVRVAYAAVIARPFLSHQAPTLSPVTSRSRQMGAH